MLSLFHKNTLGLLPFEIRLIATKQQEKSVSNVLFSKIQIISQNYHLVVISLIIIVIITK